MASMEAVALTSCNALLLLTINSWQSRASTWSLAFQTCSPVSSRNGETST